MKGRNRKTIWSLTIILSIGILLVLTLHILNKGTAIELSSHIEVGDRVVIPEHNIEPFTAGLKEAGNDQYVVSIVPGANHHFFESDFCFDRSELRDKEPSEPFMEAIKEFIEWEREMHVIP